MAVKKAKIGIIGGGVAGGSAAFYFSKLGLDVTLFEKSSTLVSGPPFCHLHAGGNLYREISDEQCITLLHQSIDLLKFYPYAVDFRPTVIVTPTLDEENPIDLLPRLKKLQKEYKGAIEKDQSNKVLGEVEEYFKLYEKKDILELQKKDTVKKPSTLDEWMIPAAKNIDISKVKFPIIIVQEYGLNIFRLSAGLNSQLKKIQNCKLMLNTNVTNVTKTEDNKYEIQYTNEKGSFKDQFDYLINAAGFNTGLIDDMLGFKRKRFVEFKAAYVTKWKEDTIWPEVVFHGKRGTPQGMAQFTPYPGGYFQLHGMTNDITLFDNGIVQSCDKSSYPKLDQKFINKIDKQWPQDLVTTRTQNAINHLAKFIPSFSDAKVAAKPLYGAQQIPGVDKDLRAADVSFEGDTYARCEVVKASSVLDMCDEIMKKLVKLGFADTKDLYKREFDQNTMENDFILKQAENICKQREYPKSLAGVNTRRKPA